MRRALAALAAAAALLAPAAAHAATLRIPVGSSPTAVATAPGFAYVASAPLSARAGRLAFVDLRRRRTVASVPVGYNPQAVALDAPTHRAFVANYAARGTVSVVDLRRRRVVRSVRVGENPANLLVARVARRRLLLVVNQGRTLPTRGSVDVFNLRTLGRVGRIAVPFTPDGVAGLAGGPAALLGDGNTGSARVVDLRRLVLARRVGVPAGPVNDVAAGPRRVYIAGAGGISVLVQPRLTPAGGVVLPRPPGGDVTVAVSSRDVGYVVNGAFGTPVPGSLQVLNGPRTIATRPLGAVALGIALSADERSVLVTSYAEGTLWVLPAPRPPR